MRLTFDQWRHEVDQFLLTLCGLTSDDLPDYLYRDDYEDGVSPGRAARKAFRAAEAF